VRSAYVQASIQAARQGADANANRLELLSKRLSDRLAEIQAAKADVDRKTGGFTSIDADRLYGMVTKLRKPTLLGVEILPSATPQLADAEAQLAEAQRTLGPNNPTVMQLRQARDVAKAKVEGQRSETAQLAQAVEAAERARQAEIDSGKRKVLSDRAVALELRLLQDEIDATETALNQVNAQIASFRQLSNVQHAAVSPMGAPEAERRPVFPNPLLIMGGAGGLGLVLAILLAVVTELMNRRLRTGHELELAAGVSLLGEAPQAKRSILRRKAGVRRRLGSKIRGRLKAAA
jgi:hypothetical protein